MRRSTRPLIHLLPYPPPTPAPGARCFACSARRFAKSSAPSLGNRVFRVGVVGGGPAGFYAAGRILSSPGADATKVDLFEVLPVPFGLARFGVAPDHPEVKNCEHKFEETARDPRFRFVGNVQIGGDVPSSSSTLVPNLSPSPHAAQIPLSDLIPYYDAILLTYGAALDRTLDIPGESLVNVLSARSFVGWYNGHPDHSSLLSPVIDLSKIHHVTIIGQGNVALDVARLLLKPLSELAETDLPEYALAALAKSRVKHVSVVGRRGPLQLAATTKELREMMVLPGVGFRIDQRLLQEAKGLAEAHPGINQARMRKRALGLLEKGSSTPLAGAEKSWSLDFLHSPIRLLSSLSPGADDPLFSTNPVKAVQFEINTLVPSRSDSSDPTTFQAQGTGEKVVSETDLVFKSVGYRSIGLPGLPFDEKRGIVRNEDGRVVTETGEKIPGMYTSGWLARGPTGVIATTMFDAYATADLIATDLAASSSTAAPKPEPPLERLAGGRKIVSWEEWQVIDNEERRRGEKRGKPREKITDVGEMLALLG